MSVVLACAPEELQPQQLCFRGGELLVAQHSTAVEPSELGELLDVVVCRRCGGRRSGGRGGSNAGRNGLIDLSLLLLSPKCCGLLFLGRSGLLLAGG
jgi:hypothetical protein